MALPSDVLVVRIPFLILVTRDVYGPLVSNVPFIVA
jgi:hypothetical protein